MEYYESVEALEKGLRNILIKQSEVGSDRVLNARTIRGVDLNKFLNEDTEESINTDDLFILFDLTNDSDWNVSEEVDERTIRIGTSFKFHIILYGNKSIELSQILHARLESNPVSLALLNLGVQLLKVGEVNDMSEFINDNFWSRCDLTMTIYGEKLINKVEMDYLMNEIDTTTEYSMDIYKNNIKNK